MARGLKLQGGILTTSTAYVMTVGLERPVKCSKRETCNAISTRGPSIS
jgi:hypothetical protein